MHSLWCIIGVLYVCGLNVCVVSAAEICRIPSGQQYKASVYRPQYASPPRNYRPTQMVRHLTRIVIVCKKDIYHDAIRHTRKSRCINGKWIPELPSCEAKGRCRAPAVVSNATPSRPLDQYITFPHGGIVKFTCNVGMLSVGNGTTICNDGIWTSMNLRCEDAPQSLPLMKPLKRDPCDDIVVPNGKVTPVHGEHGKYRVTCKKGTTINVKAETYSCQQGKWMGLTPICRNAQPKQTSCKYPYIIRSASNLKSKLSGQAINTYFVPDGTQATQTCRRMRNVVRHAVCNNARWMPPLINCHRFKKTISFRAPQSLPLMQPLKRDPCDDIVVQNGEVTPVHGERGKYKVTCKKGTTINVKAETYTCQQGKWMELTPICRNAQPKQTSCKYPYIFRIASNLKSDVSGQAINTYLVPDGTQATQTCRRMRNVVRHAVCNNARWMPPLMNCHRFKKKLSYRQAVYENCTIPESVENVTYSETQNGAVVSYVSGDIIETGQAIERMCFEQVNEDIVYASTTIYCVNGDWKPNLRPCGPLKGTFTRYRLHISTTQTSDTFPSRVVVRGTRRRKTFLPLQDFTVNSQNVREYDINAPHVGDIRKLWLETPDPSYQLRVNYVSVYSQDADTYYISRNVDVHSKNSRKRVCPRKFRSEPGWKPDWSAQTDYKTLKKIKDTTDCNMACVEEDELRCLATVYDNRMCSLFHRLEKVDMQGKPEVGGVLNVRDDNC